MSKCKSTMVKPSKKKMAATEGEKAAASKDNDSTRDQNEGFTTVKPPKMKKKFVLPRMGSKKDDKEDDMVVDKEASPRGLNKIVAEKRPRDSEEEEEEDTCYEDAEELESSFISDIKQMLEDGGLDTCLAPSGTDFRSLCPSCSRSRPRRSKWRLWTLGGRRRNWTNAACPSSSTMLIGLPWRAIMITSSTTWPRRSRRPCTPCAGR